MKSIFIIIGSTIFTSPTAIAEMSYYDDKSGERVSFPTSTYFHYGDHSKNISGTAIYLTKRELCNPSAGDVVIRDKIIISLKSGIETQDCTNEAIYSRLEDAGAVAYIKQVQFDTSGSACFWHDSFEPRSHRMVIVEVGKTFEKCASDVAFHIGPPHDDSFYRLFTSIEWTVPIRILMPLLAIWVTVTSVCIALQTKLMMNTTVDPFKIELRKIAICVCVVEGSASFLLGASAALGEWGPMALPATFYGFCYFSLLGISLATTSVVVLVLDEQLRCSPPNPLPRRSVWKHNSTKIVFLSLVLSVFDLISAVNFKSASELGELMTTLIFLFAAIANITVGTKFLYNAYCILRPLASVIWLKVSVGIKLDDPQVVKILGIAVQLVFNGLFLLGMFACELHTIARLFLGEAAHPDRFGTTVFTFLFTRLGVALCHVHAISPARKTRWEVTGVSWLLGTVRETLAFIRCTPSSVSPDDPHVPEQHGGVRVDEGCVIAYLDAAV